MEHPKTCKKNSIYKQGKETNVYCKSYVGIHIYIYEWIYII